VGKLADFVLLSDDIFTIAPEKIRDVTVAATWGGGKQTWDASHPTPGEPNPR
jgi:predicted amidohydrolase YtcJ